MSSLKRIFFLTALVILISPASFARPRPAPERTAMERLFDGHRVINIVDDFLLFWDRAKDAAPRRQERLWRRMVESKHRDYFERAVYRNADPKERRAMLNEFFVRVAGQIDAIREFNKKISDIGTGMLSQPFVYFKARFPDYQQQSDIYIAMSLFRFDGAVRPVGNDEGVPDTLCLGAEVLAGYTSEQARVAIAHEFFHLYHFSFLFQHPSLEEFKTAHMPLMIEGMAVAATEEVYQLEPRTLYLHFSDEEMAAQQRDLGASAARYLALIARNAPPLDYEPWFTNAQTDESLPRGGYLLGYEVTRRVLATLNLQQMVRMTPAELREHAEEQLAAMAGHGILLLSLSD
ncbi:MAG TPA: hypothetical protein VNI02_03915 [Blastocatellia bacterium]|jgi:hypothetical protein|nr:hypothetical protein [Blastocatellia bacterium]